MTRVAVIGGGFGGISAAIVLAKNGLEVDLIDPNEEPGGKISTTLFNGYPIDSGPTVITMKDVFENLFEIAGEKLHENVELVELDIIARHSWGSNEVLDLYSNIDKSFESINKFAGKEEAIKFRNFCELSKSLYKVLEKNYIKKQRPSILQLTNSIGLIGVKLMWKAGLMRSLWGSLEKKFSDPRLQQLFGRYSTYCGSSPWLSPSTLMLIWNVEMQGVWSVKGGIIELARALTKIAKKNGVNFHKGFCEEILTYGDNVSGVRLQGGKHILCEKIIYNGDYEALDNFFIGKKTVASKSFFKPTRSLSAITWVVRSKTRGFNLSRHNVFFDSNYHKEFFDIFKKNTLPEKPTVYICAQDRENNINIADEPERLLLLINAPPNGDDTIFSNTELKRCQSSVISLLKRCGLTIETNPKEWICSTPKEFHQRFPGTGGALYGRATHGWTSPFLRPSARSKILGLYLSGGSIHPGPGVPMVTISGQLAAEALMEDLGLANR